MIEIVGGPHDGGLMPDHGRIAVEPVVRPVRIVVREEDPSPDGPEFRTRRYELHPWWNGQRTVRRYVLERVARGFGLPQR